MADPVLYCVHIAAASPFVVCWSEEGVVGRSAVVEKMGSTECKVTANLWFPLQGILEMSNYQQLELNTSTVVLNVHGAIRRSPSLPNGRSVVEWLECRVPMVGLAVKWMTLLRGAGALI